MQRKRHINFKNLISSSSGYKNNKLHSIPILSSSLSSQDDNNLMKNKVKSNVLYSIPYSCVLALLLVGISCIVNIMINNHACYATSASLELSTNKLSGSTVENGTAIASTNVKVVVSDALDYSLILKVDNTNLTNSSVNSTSSNGGTTITAGNVVDDNTWGYKWDNATTYTAPSTSGTTLANSTILPLDSNGAISFTKTLTFGAKFGSNATAGTYSTSGTLSLVATPATTTYTITYNANGGTGAPSSTPCIVQGVAGSSCTTTLSSTKPTLTNNNLLGWSTNKDSHTAEYNVNGSITISSNITLYAIWKDTRNMSQITNMQDMNWGICDNTSTGTTYTLKDIRDNNSYTVRKFNDGRCWMTQNLRITGTIQASQSDFDSPSSLTLPNAATGFTQANQNTLKSYDDGSTGYYNWYTATAQAGTSSVTSGSVSSSICPKNWKLPTGGNSGELKAFTTAESISSGSTGATTLRGEPYNYVYSGYITGDSIASGGVGYYWSSTAYNASDTYILHIGAYRACGDLGLMGTAASPTSSCSRYQGFTMRCVAQQ